MNEESPQLYRSRLSAAGWLLIACSSAVLLAAILTFLARQLFIAELLNNFRLQIAALLLVLAFICLLARLRIWAVVQLVAGIMVMLPLFASWIPGQQPAPGPDQFSLISCNVLAGNGNKEAVVETLCNEIPDLMVVIEFEEGWVEPIVQVANAYRYSILEPRSHGFGIAVFSKFPLSNTKIETVSEEDFPIVLTEIELDGQPTILAAGHFLAPVTREQMQIRNAQLARATELIQQYRQDRGLPVLFAADFNAVPWSPYIGEMLQATGLRDSRNGFGYAGSWPTNNPLMRIPIDNVFISDSVHVHRRKILHGSSSDHLPLLMEFSISDTD